MDSQILLNKINPILDLINAEEQQDFNVAKEDKEAFGIIYTPFSLIQNMFSLFPNTVFENPNNTWLDMGAGTGYFSIYLYHMLFLSLRNQILNPEKRKEHIIKNMLYMVEIKESHIIHLKNIFGEDANIISSDFLSLTENNISKYSKHSKFNIIIGNPPYNCSGQIKTPTNTHINKTQDGKTVWPDFIKKSVELLVPGGYILAITPAIWLKPDKAEIYKLFLSTNSSKFKLLKLHTLSTNETNKIFNYQAQTPTTYYLAQKSTEETIEESNNTCEIYDKSLHQYIEYPICRKNNTPIPMSHISIIKKLHAAINKVGYIRVYKTNMPPAKSEFSIVQKCNYSYKNVKTCIFDPEKSETLTKSPPIIIYEYSNIRQAYSVPNKAKLIFAHKMFGFPFLDKSGELGISYRDNYVITDKSLQELLILQKLFSTKLALAIYDATRYRMRYLEKYAFELIPDITKLEDFPTDINDKTIADYFNFSQEEREIIEKYPEYIYF